MSYTETEPSDNVISSLTKIYTKYIKQINKFNDIFSILKNVIDIAKNNINQSGMTNIYCSNYKIMFINELKNFRLKLKSIFDQSDHDIKGATVVLIVDLLKIADTFTYTLVTSPSSCINTYHGALINRLDKIKQIILDKRIDNLYNHVANDPQIKEINKDIDILMKNIDITDITDITDDYVANKLKTKYEEFIAISPQVFTREIKQKIKRSVLELISIELNLQKKLNLKNSLPFTNAVKEFLAV